MRVSASSQPGRRSSISEKPRPKRETLVRFDSLDEMPPAEPLSDAFRALTDDEAERRHQ